MGSGYSRASGTTPVLQAGVLLHTREATNFPRHPTHARVLAVVAADRVLLGGMMTLRLCEPTTTCNSMGIDLDQVCSACNPTGARQHQSANAFTQQ